ncbi:MAG: HPP family protein [Lentisphaeria bacterium]
MAILHNPKFVLAAAAITAVLAVLSFEHPFIIGSLGSTAFTVFAMPNNITARPRNVLGGHLTGLFCGLLLSFIPISGTIAGALVLAPAVGLAMFLMVVFDFEHPPAAGTAMGAAMAGYSVDVMITVIAGSIVLCLLHTLLQKRIRDLV